MVEPTNRRFYMCKERAKDRQEAKLLWPRSSKCGSEIGTK